MAFFFDERTQRQAADFKTFLYETACALKIKHEAIARCLTVSRECVTQWLNRDGDRHMPAALIPQLPKELAIEVLRHLGKQIDIRTNITVNGVIDDEVVDLDVEMGDLIRLYRDRSTPKAVLTAQINKLDKIKERLLAEVEHR